MMLMINAVQVCSSVWFVSRTSAVATEGQRRYKQLRSPVSVVDSVHRTQLCHFLTSYRCSRNGYGMFGESRKERKSSSRAKLGVRNLADGWRKKKGTATARRWLQGLLIEACTH
ncbi:uncharacterized protein EI90DRAFT_3065680 [Cantharellus anzutake]|uniref:uncharacterized protein n=1 Tax=Cantharellus anzutake TaxID=1750568 RepID=UPI0019063E51|nr:uncharacterized protein EI90DRAFT_3065680 [Cantharellus anzutake]KAF8328126.1 hypothetical protein EI90DRAFT_3065680 [Cantharellus anzutake]